MIEALKSLSSIYNPVIPLPEMAADNQQKKLGRIHYNWRNQDVD